ncbi:MAG: GntR family transcriptional regulator [Clostridia bacterium]|nr:GntR family transcriptional regulator [Clostridia bacterium]
MINIDYRDSRTVHEQIESGFRDLIVKGIMTPDSQLPSVRELSISLTVNPNTVQKAYKQLETDGYIYSVKGKGNFVAAAKDVRRAQGTQSLYEVLGKTLQELMFLGEEKSKIQELLDKIYSEKEEK